MTALVNLRELNISGIYPVFPGSSSVLTFSVSVPRFFATAISKHIDQALCVGH
jgi:hypothetical protein